MNGLIAIVLAVAVCAVIGAGQGSIVAYVGVPSFVVTLAGYLIWQGVILGRLEVPGSIIIQDRWINYTANYYFSHDRRLADRGDHHGPLCAEPCSCRCAARTDGQAASKNWMQGRGEAGRRRDRRRSAPSRSATTAPSRAGTSASRWPA